MASSSALCGEYRTAGRQGRFDPARVGLLDEDSATAVDGGDGSDDLQCWALLELQKGFDHLLTVLEDRPQFPPTLVACADDGPDHFLGQPKPMKNFGWVQFGMVAHVSALG